MIHNFTIDHQLNHRTIRKFKDQPLTEEQLTTLFEVARQTASSELGNRSAKTGRDSCRQYPAICWCGRRIADVYH